MKRATGKKMQPLDFSFINSANLVLPQREVTRLFLVGCGGTGSWIAPALARLAAVMAENNRRTEVTFIDPDRVERGNVPRQNFAMREIGMYKAAALASRFATKWGVEIGAVCECFDARMVAGGEEGVLSIIVGAVDNPAARRAIHAAIDPQNDPLFYLPYDRQRRRAWWLDCGNHEDSGQVILGNACLVEHLRGAFASEKMCLSLPCPAVQNPELVIDVPVERKKASCAELMLANAQSLTINQRVAAEASDYLMRMLTGKPLRRFQTWLDLEAGTSRSVYITPETIARMIVKPVSFLKEK